MKSFLMIVGLIAVVLFLFAVGSFLWMGFQLNPATKEAQAYARESIFAIGTQWDTQAVLDRADEILLENINPGDVETLMGEGSRMLGEIQSLGDLECSTNIVAATGSGKIITSTCTGHAVHDRGSADYTISVRKKDGAWALNGFHFNAEPLGRQPTEI